MEWRGGIGFVLVADFERQVWDADFGSFNSGEVGFGCEREEAGNAVRFCMVVFAQDLKDA